MVEAMHNIVLQTLKECVQNNKIYFIELWWGHNHWQPKLVVYACLCDRFVEADPNIVELAISGR
jgi:hypothetical protein